MSKKYNNTTPSVTLEKVINDNYKAYQQATSGNIELTNKLIEDTYKRLLVEEFFESKRYKAAIKKYKQGDTSIDYVLRGMLINSEKLTCFSSLFLYFLLHLDYNNINITINIINRVIDCYLKGELHSVESNSFTPVLGKKETKVKPEIQETIVAEVKQIPEPIVVEATITTPTPLSKVKKEKKEKTQAPAPGAAVEVAQKSVEKSPPKTRKDAIRICAIDAYNKWYKASYGAAPLLQEKDIAALQRMSNTLIQSIDSVKDEYGVDMRAAAITSFHNNYPDSKELDENIVTGYIVHKFWEQIYRNWELYSDWIQQMKSPCQFQSYFNQMLAITMKKFVKPLAYQKEVQKDQENPYFVHVKPIFPVEDPDNEIEFMRGKSKPEWRKLVKAGSHHVLHNDTKSECRIVETNKRILLAMKIFFPQIYNREGAFRNHLYHKLYDGIHDAIINDEKKNTAIGILAVLFLKMLFLHPVEDFPNGDVSKPSLSGIDWAYIERVNDEVTHEMFYDRVKLEDIKDKHPEIHEKITEFLFAFDKIS